LDLELEGGVDLVHVALRSLSDGATMALELNDNERDVSRPELYGKEQVGDKDVVVRKKMCEMLVVSVYCFVFIIFGGLVVVVVAVVWLFLLVLYCYYI
jgi:1,4-dihydroxy-2-naphthoate octaprenyltransferase